MYGYTLCVLRCNDFVLYPYEDQAFVQFSSLPTPSPSSDYDRTTAPDFDAGG